MLTKRYDNKGSYTSDVYNFLQVIKFIGQTTPLEERTVTSVDRGILELKTAVRNLHAQVDSLHTKVDEYVLEIIIKCIVTLDSYLDIQERLLPRYLQRENQTLLDISGLVNYWKMF